MAVVAALILLAAASCGDDSDSGSDAAVTTSAPAATDDGRDHDDDHDDGHDHDHGEADAPTPYDADPADADQTIVIEIREDAPGQTASRMKADLGSVVALRVIADITEEVHLHGYDILRSVSDGNPAQFAFNAEIPGVFEIELERSGQLLMQLEIS